MPHGVMYGAPSSTGNQQENGRSTMHYEARADINAPADHVWRILTDANGMTEWDSGVERIDGRIAQGETIRVVSSANPDRTFPVVVTEWVEPRRMVWSGGMPLGLFRGTRTFTLTPSASTTTFTMREEFTGPLRPLIARSMPDLGPSFERFATGLKARSEATVEAASA
jgi:hypothetical protein